MVLRRSTGVSHFEQHRSADAHTLSRVTGHDALASSPLRPTDLTSAVGEPPSPTGVRTLDELVTRLSQLRAWSGLGYREVHRQVVEVRRRRGVPEQLSFNTVYRCMQPGRRRLDVELVVDIARALLGDEAAASAWRMAYQVLSGWMSAAGIVRVFPSLPDDLPQFTGRRAELRRLLGGLTPQGPDLGPGVWVVEGMAGVGKTMLAVHAGHQLLRRGLGTDVQLSVNLRGYDREQPPADPAAVLDGFLRVLGVPGDQIYHLDLAGRSTRYRRLLAGRRALIVLDNAATAEQVTPLLPQTAGCLTMITSRNALASLPGARRLPLGAFSEPDALDLLRRTVGPDRVDAAPAVAAGIARLVGCLPLALGVVAGRINDSPEWTLADHLARLTERTQLRQLDSGIELALDLSYHALAPDLRRMLRLLALHCGRDLDAYAAAALTGTDLPTANERLDDLVAANLLQRRTPTRYHFHDLIGVYAAARAIDGEPDSARQAALTRLFDSYLYTSSQATDALRPAKRHRRPRIPAPRTPTPRVADRTAARAWMLAEHANLLAAVAHTATCGWPTHTTRFGVTLAWWLYTSGHYTDALTVHGHTLDAARQSGDRTAEGVTLINLGYVRLMLGQYRGAVAALRQSLRISQEIGDRHTEGDARGFLGLANAALGRYTNALKHLFAAAAILRQIGDRSAEGGMLNNIGDIYEQMGEYDQAVTYYRQALAINRELHDHAAMGVNLGGLSSAYARAGRLPEARQHYRLALALNRENGYRAGEAYMLSIYGLVYGADHPDTQEHHQRAVAIAREIGAPDVEVDVVNNIGETLRAIGCYNEALRNHQSALARAQDTGNRNAQARAHDGIAHVMHATDRPDQARAHWQQALALSTELGLPLARQIHACLDAFGLPDQHPSNTTCR
jgi:tetratricopeptide (TPR) repeat protein